MEDLDIGTLLEGVVDGASLEGILIGVAAAALVWGISKLPGPWKKRITEVIDKTDEKLDKNK